MPKSSMLVLTASSNSAWSSLGLASAGTITLDAMIDRQVHGVSGFDNLRPAALARLYRGLGDHSTSTGPVVEAELRV